jgi:hypothetical protein
MLNILAKSPGEWSISCFRLCSDILLYIDVIILTDVEEFLMNSGSVDEHMYLLLPALVRLFRPDVSNAPLDIRRAAIKTLGRLLPYVQVLKLIQLCMQRC